MNEDDIKFLAELSKEMNEQETDGQADPIFWVVAQTERIWNIKSDFDADGICIIMDECEFDNLDEFVEGLVNEGYLKEDNTDFTTYEEVIDALAPDIRDLCYTVNYRENKNSIVEGTLFLTKKECQEHINKNYYHYNNPHTYGMSAWRSPEVERLFKILKDTDWNSLIKEK
jgi:hypothetical protein